MSETTTDKIPTWVWVYGVLFMTGVPIFFGSVTLINADMLFPGMAGTPAAELYGVRNITAGLVGMFALYRRSQSMLLLVFILRLTTDLIDQIVSLDKLIELHTALSISIGNVGSTIVITLWSVGMLGGAAWGIRTFWSAND